MSLQKPVVCEVAKDTYIIDMFGEQSPTLLVGNEKALLIDTACGNYDLAGLVQNLTDKPLTVVLTHGHGDHAGGVFQFETVWCHPLDHDMVRDMTDEQVDGYCETMKKNDQNTFFDTSRQRLPGPHPCPTLLPLSDGQEFDLGGRTVTVHHTPGHTKGEVVLIDHQSRILFSGDAVNSNLGIFGTGLETALWGLQNLKTYEKQWDRNFTGHTGWGGDTCLTSVSPSIFPTCMALMQEVLDGSLQGDVHPTPLGDRYNVVRDGVIVSYDPAHLRE